MLAHPQVGERNERVRIGKIRRSLPVREQLKLHRKDSACNDCHRGIDPWGIALENYGADGLWRDEIKRRKPKGRGLVSQAVVAGASLPDGTEVTGMQELKSYLLNQRSEQFAKALTTKLLTYALGRSLEVTDQPTIEDLTTKFVRDNYRIDLLIQQIVLSKPFQTK